MPFGFKTESFSSHTDTTEFNYQNTNLKIKAAKYFFELISRLQLRETTVSFSTLFSIC